MIHPKDIELLTKARKMIETMRQHPPGSPSALLLQNFLPGGLDYDLADLLLELERHASRPVVLAFEMPGYVTLGHVDAEVTLQDPDLEGLRIAGDVFLHGLNAPVVLRASDWGKTPRAAANAVHRAATWAARHCPALAAAMNQISFANDGRPSYTPARPIEVRVFSAYSGATPP
ncbi:MAG: hypothetical protein K0B16_18025 [Burkholderiaceae bacterium]|nr:hypothetical protein [Burkholderiaceae bacterium]